MLVNKLYSIPWDLLLSVFEVVMAPIGEYWHMFCFNGFDCDSGMEISKVGVDNIANGTFLDGSGSDSSHTTF